jgi:hypothetical protein
MESVSKLLANSMKVGSPESAKVHPDTTVESSPRSPLRDAGAKEERRGSFSLVELKLNPEEAKMRVGSSIILPNTLWKQSFDLVIVLLAIYDCYTMPFRAAFSTEFEISYSILIFIDALFLLDLLANFYTAFELRGNIVADAWKIQKRYLSGWFLIDFLSQVPIEMLVSRDDFRTFNLLRCIRLFRFARILKFLEKMKRIEVSPYANQWRIAKQVQIEEGGGGGPWN